MDDVKDKMKGLFKKVNNSISSSSSGKFKGQGRVLGSSSSSEPTNPNPIRPRLLSDSRPSQSSSVPTNSKPQPEKTTGSYPEPPKVSESGFSSSNGERSDGFDPFNSLITSGKRNPNGYSLNIIECPVCGQGFGSEEEVSEHVDSCLSNSMVSNSNLGSKTLDDNQEIPVVVSNTEVHNELESCIATYVSGKPANSSKEVMIRLLSNMVKEPENSKFRRIRLGNPKIKEAICDAAGGVDLLECVGFELKEEDGEMWAVMDVLSQDKLILVRKAVSLLEPPPPPKAFPPPPAKELPVVPEKLDRQVRVFFSVSENIAARIQLPDSFYNISPEEARREAEMKKKKLAESQLLIPKSYKEQKAQAAKKRYTKSLIRVQFPDGVVLQAVFSPREPTSALYEFVSSALKDPSLEFELLHPVVIKRRVIPHFSAVGGKPVTLEDEELVPTSLVKFRPIETEDSVFTGLCNELLMKCEPLVS